MWENYNGMKRDYEIDENNEINENISAVSFFSFIS